jgi:hypothetical protein
MSRIRLWILFLGAGLGFLTLTAARSIADEGGETAKTLATRFLDKLSAKDAESVAGMAGVPWLAEKQHIVKDAVELKKLLQERLKTVDAALARLHPHTAIPYADIRKEFGDEATRELLDQTVGMDGRIVLLVGDDPQTLRYLLVRGGRR